MYNTVILWAGSAALSKGCTDNYTRSFGECKSCTGKQWNWAQSRDQKESGTSQSSWSSLGGSNSCRVAGKYVSSPLSFFYSGYMAICVDFVNLRLFRLSFLLVDSIILFLKPIISRVGDCRTLNTWHHGIRYRTEWLY